MQHTTRSALRLGAGRVVSLGENYFGFGDVRSLAQKQVPMGPSLDRPSLRSGKLLNASLVSQLIECGHADSSLGIYKTMATHLAGKPKCAKPA